MPDFIDEISFRTARSGGKGGQNVNKVETMVEGLWDLNTTTNFSPEQLELIREKLASRINKDGILQVRSSVDRTQSGNKERVKQKMQELVAAALTVRKKRKPTRISKAIKKKRSENKKHHSEIKSNRQKIK